MAPRTTKPKDDAQPEAPVEPTVETPAEPTVEPAAETPAETPAEPEGRITTSAAPLEAPAPPTRIETPDEGEGADAPVTAGNLGAALVKNAVPGARLVDNATNKAPDPRTLFADTEGPGVMVVCTVRLCQDSWIGPHENPIRQLVMAQGQTTGPEKAAQILAVLNEQIAEDTAATPAE